MARHAAMPMTVVNADGVAHATASPYVCLPAPVQTQAGMLAAQPAGVLMPQAHASAHQMTLAACGHPGYAVHHAVHPHAASAHHMQMAAPVAHPGTMPPPGAPHPHYAVHRGAPGCYLAAAPPPQMQPAPPPTAAVPPGSTPPHATVMQLPEAGAVPIAGPAETAEVSNGSGDAQAAAPSAPGAQKRKLLSIHAPDRSLVNAPPLAGAPAHASMMKAANGAPMPPQQQSPSHYGAYPAPGGGYVLMAPGGASTSWAPSSATPVNDAVEGMLRSGLSPLDGTRGMIHAPAYVTQAPPGAHPKPPGYGVGHPGYALGYQVLSPVMSPLGLVVDPNAVFASQDPSLQPGAAGMPLAPHSSQ